MTPGQFVGNVGLDDKVGTLVGFVRDGGIVEAIDRLVVHDVQDILQFVRLCRQKGNPRAIVASGIF